MNTLFDAMGEAYFQRALAMVVLLGVAGGVAGAHVLMRRSAFYVVALSHATFPAVVAATLLGVSTLVGGAVGALLVAGSVTLLARRRHFGQENAIALVLGAAFALGLVLVSVTSASARTTGVLVGSLSSVDSADLRNAALATIVAVGGFGALHKEMVFAAFDPTGASAAGYRRSALDLVALVLMAVVVSAAVPAVGALLAVSMVIPPALIARRFTDRAGRAVLIGAVASVVIGAVGLAVSTIADLAPGGTVAITAAAALLLAQRPRSVGSGQRRSGSSGDGALGAGSSGLGTLRSDGSS